jgi:hypothetical protein
MVKVTNLFGDIKIGKQGLCVYQRVHGQQVRRLLSPKRGIESKAQAEHRQLFQFALAWRKQLTRDNRNFLEDYALSHGIVDSYGAPLTWDKLALKIVLEKPKMILL